MTNLLQGRRALVLYGSETGNAQDVAEELGRIAERLRFDTEVTAFNAIKLVCPERKVNFDVTGVPDFSL